MVAAYRMVLPVMMMASAGRISPVSNSITSPTSRSKTLMSCTSESRRTVTCNRQAQDTEVYALF